MQETNIEARWPELFTPLTRAERDVVLDGCWQLVRQGRPLTRAAVVELVRGVHQGNAPRRAGGVMGRIARAA
ncbi:hypothetical protein [Leucobacter musarum]|uniref:hypothetical protein n=1 Tax=Leucobacter musarum TaxID=1930747 RepID=UPI000A71CCA1|nr:hypothetical protein [Leucobacter musarum]